MNELDLKTKIEGLEKAIKEHKDFAGNYESDLAKTEQQLKDYNKIALPPMVFDDIYEAIDRAVCQYDFSNSDNYNIEYGIEYDGKVYAESIELQHNGDLIEAIVEKVHDLFKEADAPEDDQVNNVTEVKEVI